MLKCLKIIALPLFWLAGGLFAHCLAADITQSPRASYSWGRGYSIPQANLNLGGYFQSTLTKAESQPAHVTLDDISLFISWSPFDRLHFFSEIELEDIISTREIQTLNQSLSLERYYFDYFFSQSTSFRIGKFLTPVGIWNINHAAPLVWTTTRPLVTEDQVFSSHATGLMATKTFTVNDLDIDASLFLDDSDDLEPRKNHFHDFTNAIGSRIHILLNEDLNLGVSYLTYKKRADFHNARNHLFGLDALWTHNGYELQAEFIYRYAGRDKSEKGFYLQGVVPLGRDFYAVNRYEYLTGTHLFYETSAIKSTTHLGITGLAWRPYTPLVFKAEYRFGHDNEIMAPSGVFASISMFF